MSDKIARGARISASVLTELVLLAIFVAGIAVVCYGVWLIYEPAAYITAGITAAGMVALYVNGASRGG